MIRQCPTATATPTRLTTHHRHCYYSLHGLCTQEHHQMCNEVAATNLFAGSPLAFYCRQQKYFVPKQQHLLVIVLRRWSLSSSIHTSPVHQPAWSLIIHKCPTPYSSAASNISTDCSLQLIYKSMKQLCTQSVTNVFA